MTKVKMTPEMRQEYHQLTTELVGRQAENDILRQAFNLPPLDLALDAVIALEAVRMSA